MKQNEKGSVTMIVAVTIFFIVILLSSFFIYTTSRRRAQIEETERIAEAYDGDMDAVYAEEISKQDRDLFDYDPPTEGISLKDGEKYYQTDEQSPIPIIQVPDIYKEQPVTKLGIVGSNGHVKGFNSSNITEITFPNTITEIIDGNLNGDEYGVFTQSTSLTTVVLPDSITKIGSAAFRGCSSLENINIPARVTTIGDKAFKDCVSISNITLADGLTSLGSSTFENCTKLQSISIPSGVTIINDSTFKNCTNLTTITTGDNITTIGNNAFENTTKVTSITLPSTVENVGANAFNGWTSSQIIYVVGKSNINDFDTHGNNCFGGATVIYSDASYTVANSTSNPYYSYTAPETGYYDIVLNGAAGGSAMWSLNSGLARLLPNGGKVTLRVYITKGSSLYFVVGGGGGRGGEVNRNTTYSYGGYNGGGRGGIGLDNYRDEVGQYCGSGGGGATTVAISLNGTDGRLQSYGNATTASRYFLGVAGGGGGTNHGNISYTTRDCRGGATDERSSFGVGESGGDYSGTTCTQSPPNNIEGSGGGGRRLVWW